MTIASMNIVSVFGAIAAVCFSSFAQAQSQDPTSYFNATDHDAYLAWLKDSSREYNRTTFLPSPAGPLSGAAIHWTIEGDRIYLAVAARATGWVGFGIAENGGMFGADVVLFLAATNTLQDSYILDYRFPNADACQDWTLLNSKTDGGFLIFEAVRLLDTGDTQDRAIIDDSSPEVASQRVIAAWSDAPTPEYHGPNNRVRGALRFFADVSTQAFAEAMAAEAQGTLELGAVDYPIKPIDTEYATFCFSNADLITNMSMPNNTELHTIGFEPIVDPRSTKYVHHFVLYGSSQANDDVGCNETDWIEMAYVWAPGDEPLLLPSNVGGPLGENGHKSFQLQIHYNNPWSDTGVLDSSGVRLYYTSVKREYDLGILEVGDPFISLYGQPVGDGYVQHSFDCPASCSSTVLQQSVTVIREGLHMHKTGRSMNNYQSRDGQVIRSGKVQFFSFDQQGVFSVPQPAFQVQAGDSFRTECFYDATGNVTFGLSSQQEMCMAFLFYYPRQQVDLFGTKFPFVCGYGLSADLGVDFCDSNWKEVQLSSSSDLNRTFGIPSGNCSVATSPSSSASFSSVATAIFSIKLALLVACMCF